MSKTVLNFITALSVWFIATLFVSLPGAGAGDSGGGSIDAGSAWDAYNRGSFTEAERQFLFLIDKSEQEQQSISKNPEEILNLQLGLAYTRTKLANLILSKEIPSSSEEVPLLSKQLLISSKELFAGLIRKRYKLTDCVPAILDILSQLKEYKTMDEYLPLVETLFSGEELDKWNYLFAESAWAAYNRKNYQLAQKKFETLLQKNLNETINPDTVSLITGLGYTLYQQEKYGAAYELLNDLMQKRNIESTPAIAELKLMVCRKLADPFTSKVKKGKYGIVNGYDNIFYNRHKTGDKGTSRLDERGVVINSDNNVTLLQNDLDIFFRSRHLSNGASGSVSNKTGNFYRYLNGQKALFRSSNDNIILNDASLKWNIDNITIFSDSDFNLETSLGISPLGGALSPTSVFTLKAEHNNGWHGEIHRTVVDNSILSISGLDDPYSDQEWGRVVKNGISLAKNISFWKNNWFSINGEFNAYRGLNVWQNSSYQLNAASGKTVTMKNGDEMTFGLYATWMHFEHNSNFYTFGHGGYYSPDFMFTAGPLLQYKIATCQDYRMACQLSVGWMKERNADAPKYPIHYEIVDQFTASSIDELQGIYSGEHKESMVGSIKLEGWKIVTEHLAAGSFFSMGASSDDLEWRLGGAIEYSFDVRGSFLQQKSAF